MAFDTQIGDVQRFVVIPVMPFEASSPPAPRAAFRSRDQAELLTKGGRVTRRARPDSPGAKPIDADFQVSAEAGEFGVEMIVTALFHRS